MLKKVKSTQGYLYLTQAKQPRIPQGSVEPAGWQSFDPGEEGAAFREKVTELAQAGAWDCFIFTDASLKSPLHQRLPFWIRQLKTEHPQIDFHIRSGRPV